MLCLGLAGGLNRVQDNPLNLTGAFLHDGAAVLVRDGHVVAGIEEERLNRIKHSNKFPASSIRFCLDTAGVALRDLDAIGFYATEDYCNALLAQLFAGQPDTPVPLDARLVLQQLLAREFRTEVDPATIHFVGHHEAHAVSAFAMSGFDESLVLAIDGYGDFLSGMVAHGRDGAVTTLETFSQAQSLGLFYLAVTRFLGYSPFDEYKVMGLAPYGHAGVYRDLFARLYALDANGGYRVFTDRVGPALVAAGAVRRRGAAFTQQHSDVAAALQEALERIVLHVLTDRRAKTGLANLCLAGGVAHNCTVTGKLLYSGLFDDIFVQPAAHDAGCALGAALMLSAERGHPAPKTRLREVYWGTPIADDDAVARDLGAWGGFLDLARSDDIAGDAADLLADGAVIGWVQGRSEFGPRALGNRSILADPRPAANKDRINAMVKKREGYRPFAPSVIEEAAHTYFDLPDDRHDYPFMNFVVPVRVEHRARLGAITHVDGTARLQTVSRDTNPAYWGVIAAFGQRTGVPILLNTSFNNNAEPIVDSVEDAVATFLTTDLDALVVGPFLARKRAVAARDWWRLGIALPPYVRLQQTRGLSGDGAVETRREIRTSFSSRAGTVVSRGVFDALMTLADGGCGLGDLRHHADAAGGEATMLAEIRALWEQRLVRLHPPTPAGDPPVGARFDLAAAAI